MTKQPAGDLSAGKAALRRSIRRKLAEADPAAQAAASLEIVKQVLALPAWQTAGALAAFHPLTGEVDLRPLLTAALAAGKSLVLPRVAGDEIVFHLVEAPGRQLVLGSLGIREPDPGLPEFDLRFPGRSLVLVPGLAFDRAGRRLGRGRGYYDRFLRRFRSERGGDTIAGVCFSLQLVDELPAGDGDEPVDFVISA